MLELSRPHNYVYLDRDKIGSVVSPSFPSRINEPLQSGNLLFMALAGVLNSAHHFIRLRIKSPGGKHSKRIRWTPDIPKRRIDPLKTSSA